MKNFANNKMLYQKVLIAIFLITFFNVILCATKQPEDCDFPCDQNDTLPVCVLDKDEYCFLSLPSKCAMERLKCVFQKDYEIYDHTYCSIEGLKCPVFQSPPLDSEQLHTYNENPEENIEVILQNKNENYGAENLNTDEDILEQLAIQDNSKSNEDNTGNGEIL